MQINKIPLLSVWKNVHINAIELILQTGFMHISLYRLQLHWSIYDTKHLWFCTIWIKSNNLGQSWAYSAHLNPPSQTSRALQDSLEMWPNLTLTKRFMQEKWVRYPFSSHPFKLLNIFSIFNLPLPNENSKKLCFSQSL